MKNLLIALLLFSLALAPASAERLSENYFFVRDLTDCLYRMQLASLDSIEKAQEAQVKQKLYNQLPNLLKAKTYMKQWLENKNSAIKATAMGMYVDISEIEQAVRNLIAMLEKPQQENIPLISSEAQKMSETWNDIYQTSGLALWAIIKPAASESPSGNVPFIISDEERQNLLKYINKIFADEFKAHEELEGQKRSGQIEDFTLSTPAWSALHLRDILTTQTYEEAKKQSL
ncbi:MAG: hypothetical protein V1727_00910 [Candidatus Omnitrophota bacterium]